MNKRRAIVLDTSAFIAGFDPFAVDDELYSVPAVREELTGSSLSKVRFDTAMERGKLKVLEPSFQHLSLVKKASKKIGDMLFLSEADMQILALALQLKEDGYASTIITDDYSIQNVARKIKVDSSSLITLGIRFYLHWQLYCPACRKKYPSDYRFDRCEICGTKLKRKPLSKRLIKKQSRTNKQPKHQQETSK